MQKKIIGIFVCMLMIVAFVLPATGMINNKISRENKFLNNQKDMDFVPGELIVKLKEYTTLSRSSFEILNEKYNVYGVEKIFSNAEGTILDDIYLMHVSTESDILSMIKEYASCPDVVYAEPNGILTFYGIPNDTDFNKQWSLHNTGQMILNNISGTPDVDIDAPEAWEIETGNPDVVIAIIDTGIDYTHPELDPKIWNNIDEIPNNDIDDDSNGYIDDVIGWDFFYNDNNVTDGHGHGTMVAGVIAASTDNGIGIAGIACNCKIMTVRIGDPFWHSNSVMAANGIKYAADNGADVISMSFGWYTLSSTLLDAVNYAYGKGVFLCAAVGNSNLSTKSYPAAYDNVTAVAATNQNDKRRTKEDWDPNDYMPGDQQGSNYGDYVDIAAPGNLIYTTMPNYHVTFNDVISPYTGEYLQQNYDFMGGTSSSSPIVAGVAALLLSQDSTLTNDEVRRIIRANVDPYDSEKYIGTGRINAYKALMRENTQPETPDTPTGKTNGRPGREYSFTTSATDEDGDELWYFWDWGDGNNSEWIGPYSSNEQSEVSYTWSQEANFSIKVKVKDGKGGESYWSEEFIFSTPKSKNSLVGNDIVCSDPLEIEMPKGINPQAIMWFFSGLFKLVDSDEEYAYFKVINGRFLGIGPGIMYYHLSLNLEIKMMKPYHALFGIMRNTSIPFFMIGNCKYWDYVR